MAHGVITQFFQGLEYKFPSGSYLINVFFWSLARNGEDVSFTRDLTFRIYLQVPYAFGISGILYRKCSATNPAPCHNIIKSCLLVHDGCPSISYKLVVLQPYLVVVCG